MPSGHRGRTIHAERFVGVKQITFVKDWAIWYIEIQGPDILVVSLLEGLLFGSCLVVDFIHLIHFIGILLRKGVPQEDLGEDHLF